MSFSKSVGHLLLAVSAEIVLLMPGGDFLVDQWRQLNGAAAAQVETGQVSEEFTVCVLPVERMVAMGWDVPQAALAAQASASWAHEPGCTKPY